MKNLELNNQIEELRKLKNQIFKLRKLYDLIENCEVKDYLKKIIIVSDKIYKEIAVNSNKISKVQKLIDYYIVTARKIVSRYAKLKINGIDSVESNELYMKIEKFMPRLNEYFEKIYESLFSAEILEVDAEIEVFIKELGIKKDL